MSWAAGRTTASVRERFHEAFTIGSLDNVHDVMIAAEHVIQGGVIAFQVGGVFGLLIDGANEQAVRTVLQVKEDEPNRKFSGMLETQRFLSLVDLDNVHPGIVGLLQDPGRFDETIAQICHVRAPITMDAASLLPVSMVSFEGTKPYLHNLDVVGHPMDNLNVALESLDTPTRAVTTLNRHKREPEITELVAAVTFCTDGSRRESISLLLTDPTPQRPTVRGSFPIIDLTRRDDGKLTGKRHGRIPFPVVERIIGIPIDDSRAIQPAYEQGDFRRVLETGVSQQALRRLAIAFMSQV